MLVCGYNALITNHVYDFYPSEIIPADYEYFLYFYSLVSVSRQGHTYLSGKVDVFPDGCVDIETLVFC